MQQTKFQRLFTKIKNVRTRKAKQSNRIILFWVKQPAYVNLRQSEI